MTHGGDENATGANCVTFSAAAFAAFSLSLSSHSKALLLLLPSRTRNRVSISAYGVHAKNEEEKAKKVSCSPGNNGALKAEAATA